MRLILVRHGAAHAGFAGPIAGPIGCVGLTDLGREQAALLADRLADRHGDDLGPVDHLVTSTLPRAIETARLIAPALGFADVPEDCAWCEVHTGEADGVEWADYPSRFGSFDMVAEPDRPFAPGGDSWNSFHRRVEDLMTDLTRDRPGQTVMAVCHAGVIAASLRIRFGGVGVAPTARLTPANTSLTEWWFDESSCEWTLRSYNDARHLARFDA